jgi:peroxiredoxin
VIDRYGLLNPDGKGWPHPTTYVIDTKGVVRWKFTETNYTIRPTNKQILQELRKLK